MNQQLLNTIKQDIKVRTGISIVYTGRVIPVVFLDIPKFFKYDPKMMESIERSLADITFPRIVGFERYDTKDYEPVKEKLNINIPKVSSKQ